MPLVNTLKTQVDLPVWEWLRFSPVAPSAGLSCSCSSEISNANSLSSRYIYYLINATNFWRYDTVADTYAQMATPPQAPATASAMRFSSANHGYFNRVISATSNTITSGLPFGGSAVGYKIRIVSGKGAGQERVITSVGDPIVADYGAATAGSTTSLTDTSKTWTSGYVGSTLNVNAYAGHVVRTLFGTGANQVRKILYNSATVLTVGDVNFFQNDLFANCTWTAPAAGTVYQIESSVITVDSPWDVVPDNTSRFLIQSGAIWLISGATAAPFYTLQYYDVLHDMWYSKPALTNMIGAGPSDVSMERVSETASIWHSGVATSGSTTSLADSSANWQANQWVGHQVYIFSGTGRGQIVEISSNTATSLSFSAVGTGLDSTSRYQIMGYDAGKSSGSNTYNTLYDSSKSWEVNRYANYGVRILYGTGAGQLRQIISNTADTLTVYSPWNVMPDETSVYSIQGASDTMYITWGGSAEVFMHNGGTADMLSHGRTYDSGVACVACALLSDADHTIYENAPIAISSLSGTTTITATTAQPHNLRVGQYVSIRGVTSAAADQHNVTGLCQITTVPSVTTFTYVPFSAGTGTYAYLTALSTSNLSDASKDFRDVVSSATNTTVTFARKTPSNINGWYVTGTNITQGVQVVSGAGTNTLTLSAGSAVPSGVLVFSPWGPSSAVTGTYSSGGGAGVATVTLAASTPSSVNGWFVSGTGIAIGATVVSGAGTATITLSTACTGAVSGTITFNPPTATGKVAVMTTGAPTVTTGATVGQLMRVSSVLTGTMGFQTTLGAAPVAALTRYVICSPLLLGAALDQTLTNYNSGVATGGSTTTLVDSGAFWATATGTGSAQATTVTLSAVSPGNINGWYVSGTGIGTGAQVVSGAGTNTLTLSVPNSASVSGTITCAAWNQSLVGRRIKIQSGATGLNQELLITGVTPSSGTITFGAATAPVSNVAVYSLLSIPVKGAGHEIKWASGNSILSKRGRYIWLPRGGAVVGIDRLDLTTDKVVVSYLIPFAETLGSGSMYAYDGKDRLYFTKDVTLRFYYLDLNTNWIHGAGLMPYVAGTAGIGNKMEIFSTEDGLKYLWVNRQQAQEHFRQLLFY